MLDLISLHVNQFVLFKKIANLALKHYRFTGAIFTIDCCLKPPEHFFYHKTYILQCRQSDIAWSVTNYYLKRAYHNKLGFAPIFVHTV